MTLPKQLTKSLSERARAQGLGTKIRRPLHNDKPTRLMPEWTVWQNMKSRCYNPGTIGWEHYGKRGIIVCAEWRNSFRKFYADMGTRPTPKHQIDRIDNNGDYCKENCQWVTRLQNVYNRTVTLHLEFRGKMRTCLEIAELTGLTTKQVRNRVKNRKLTGTLK